MKHHLSKILILSALLPMSSAPAIPIEPDEVTLQMNTVPLNTASMDDYLLDMARLNQINIIADATNFPADSTVVPYPSTSGAIAGQKGENGAKPENWRAALLIVMGDFVAQKRLSTLRPDARTFVLWSEPDPRQMLALQGELTRATEAARWAEAIAAVRANGVPEDEIIRGELSEDQLQTVLRDYLESIGWKGTVAERNNRVDIRVPFSKLPPDLRELVLLDIRKGIINGWPDDLGETMDWNTTAIHLSSDENPRIEIWHQSPTKSDDATAHVFYGLTTLDEALDAPTDAPVASMQEPRFTPAQLGPKDTLFNAYGGLSKEDDSDYFLKRRLNSNLYKGVSEKVAIPSLDADAALQTRLSLQAKRLPLRDFVAQLQQQSGVRLTLSEDAPADKLITARVAEMPLSQLMNTLSRVYGVKWNKTGDATYQMRGNDQGELHLKLLQIGDPKYYRYRFMFYTPRDRKEEEAAIGKAIVNQFGVEALETPGGVAFSALPPTLQHRLHYALEDRGAEDKVVALYQTNRILVEQMAQDGLSLRFGTPISKSYIAPYKGFDRSVPQDRLRFDVQSEDTTLVMPVFNSFYAAIAKPGETAPRPRSRRR